MPKKSRRRGGGKKRHPPPPPSNSVAAAAAAAAAAPNNRAAELTRSHGPTMSPELTQLVRSGDVAGTRAFFLENVTAALATAEGISVEVIRWAETLLYEQAPSLEAYADPATIEQRVMGLKERLTIFSMIHHMLHVGLFGDSAMDIDTKKAIESSARELDAALFSKSKSIEEYADESTFRERFAREVRGMSDTMVKQVTNFGDSDTREVIFFAVHQVCTLRLGNKMSADAILTVAVKCEEVLYDNAPSLEEYANVSTLELRCEEVLHSVVVSMATTAVTSNEAQLWPYQQRYKLLQLQFAKFDRAVRVEGDVPTAIDIGVDMLAMPHNTIGDLRACVMMMICGLFSHGEGYRGLFFADDRNYRLLKTISHDQREHPCTRIMALLLRCMFPLVTRSSDANCYRRTFHILRAELEAIQEYPSEIRFTCIDGTSMNFSPMKCDISPSPTTSYSSKVRVVFKTIPLEIRTSYMLEALVVTSRRCSQQLEGPAKDDAHSDPCYALKVGGAFCDGCGKTAEVVGLPMLFKCKKCRLAHYCSESCQSQCWKEGHAEYCKQFGCFEVGDRVLLQTLRSAENLNGETVRIESRAASGRWVVRLLHPDFATRGVISVKPENIRHPRPLK